MYLGKVSKKSKFPVSPKTFTLTILGLPPTNKLPAVESFEIGRQFNF